MKDSSRPLTRTSLTQDRHFLTSDSEFLKACSCILMSSDTIGSMNIQNDCVCVRVCVCVCVYVCNQEINVNNTCHTN